MTGKPLRLVTGFLTSPLASREFLSGLEKVVNDWETFKIGDRVLDFPTGFKGVFVGFREDRVVFDTYELGHFSRPADLLFKLE